MRALLDELQKLWIDISVQDFSKEPGERRFRLMGILIWTICDYPTLGLILGLYTHGYRACVVCGLESESQSTKSRNKLDADKKIKRRKIVFLGAKQ